MIVDLPDASKIPAVAEPLFLAFNAKVRFIPCMTPEDLKNAGLDELCKGLSDVLAKEELTVARAWR